MDLGPIVCGRFMNHRAHPWAWTGISRSIRSSMVRCMWGPAATPTWTRTPGASTPPKRRLHGQHVVPPRHARVQAAERRRRDLAGHPRPDRDVLGHRHAQQRLRAEEQRPDTPRMEPCGRHIRRREARPVRERHHGDAQVREQIWRQDRGQEDNHRRPADGLRHVPQDVPPRHDPRGGRQGARLRTRGGGAWREPASRRCSTGPTLWRWCPGRPRCAPCATP